MADSVRGDDSTGAATSDAVTARAPGKINLELVVGPREPDGYHDLATVFHAVTLYQTVTVAQADGISVTTAGTGAGDVPDDDTNLAVRAATLLARHAGIGAGARIEVQKQVPVAAGMAGGSADAAATLVACDTLWGTGCSREDLLSLGAELGSDVPFALTGGTALGTGRGDHVTPALARGHYFWVLALAAEGLSTPRVYAECDRLREGRVLPQVRTGEPLMQALRTGDPAQVGPLLANDLQDAACSLRPTLRGVIETGLDYGAAGAVVSGSGPTVALLARDHEQSLDLAVALTTSGVVSDVRRVTGPAAGARLVEAVSVG